MNKKLPFDPLVNNTKSCIKKCGVIHIFKECYQVCIIFIIMILLQLPC